MQGVKLLKEKVFGFTIDLFWVLKNADTFFGHNMCPSSVLTLYKNLKPFESHIIMTIIGWLSL